MKWTNEERMDTAEEMAGEEEQETVSYTYYRCTAYMCQVACETAEKCHKCGGEVKAVTEAYTQ